MVDYATTVNYLHMVDYRRTMATYD